MPPPTSSSRPPRSRRERCGAALSARLAVCVAPAPTGLVGLLASNELDLRSAAGGPVPGGRYVVGAQPEKHDPYLSISSTRLATVVVRGNGGSTEPDSLHPMSTAHFISNIWITDQDGAVICDQEFDGTEASPTFSCQLATSVTMVQSHEFCNLHGLWSGPTVTVEFEVFAARKEETTSVNGNGPTLFHVATSTPTKHDPYTVYDRDTRTGRTVVLGDGGSTTDLHPHNPSHYIEAIWSRDQHGTIVTFADLSESIRGPTTEFDLSAAVPTVTKLIPYEFCNLHGLWQGNDALGYAAIRASTSLNVRSATGGGVPGGRYEIASAPKKHEPFMKITSSRVANVVVRGNGGSTEAGGLHPQGPCHYISNIWITDQNGDVVCERLFDGSEASPTMSCQLPDSVTMAQSHEFCNLHGLWSGPMLTVADETFASGKEEMTSVSGTGPTTYNEATAIMAKHDPYIAYDRATKTGSIVVLGVNGSTVNLHPQSFPNHYVEAIWARDQHGSIVFFESLTTATAPRAAFDLSATVPPVTSLVPFEYCNLHGLWRGLNSIGFAAIRDQTTLDLGMPGPGVPGGRYEVGAAPRKHEPYMKISSSSSAHVVVRGNNGSTAAGSLHPMSSGHFISNIWVTDQDGTIICEQLFDGSEASPEMDCEIPPETDTVQSHEFCNLHGLWSGPIVTVAYEVFASGKEESTSSTGVGPTLYHAAESTPVKHDPHLVYDSTRRVGYAMVLGTNGSEQNLHPQSYPGHYVEAIWARDQHGSIVFFESLTTATAPRAAFDLSATVPPVTSLVPFEYCNLHGLWRGLNSIGFAAIRDQTTLDLGMPGPGVPGGRYEVGAAPRKHEPYMKISSSSSAHVVVRGNNGSTAAGSLHPMSSGHFISNIWVTDQDGTIICEQLFDGSEASPEMDCEIPPETDTVQSHEFCNLHGLWSGPIVTVAYEVFASGKEESTSSTGVGPTLYHAAESTPVKHDPHLVYDSTRRVGYAMVLGTNGSEQNLHPQSYPGHYVEAMWARDQHDTVVGFAGLGEDMYMPVVTFDFSNTVPAATVLIPYEFCNLHGLWQGVDAVDADARNNLPEMSPDSVDAQDAADDDSGLDGGAIAGIVIAVVIVVGVMVMAVIHQKRTANQPPVKKDGFGFPPADSPNLAAYQEVGPQTTVSNGGLSPVTSGASAGYLDMDAEEDTVEANL